MRPAASREESVREQLLWWQRETVAAFHTARSFGEGGSEPSPARVPGCPSPLSPLIQALASFPALLRILASLLMRPSAGGFESPVSSRCCDLLSSFLCPSGHPSQTKSFWEAGPVPPQTPNPHSPCFLGRW